MLTFAVVASRHGRPLDPATLRRFATATAAEVPFPPDDSVTWTNDAGTVWFVGWQPPGRDDRESGWCLDADGLTAVAGRAWPVRAGWRDAAPVAAQLARRLQAEPLVTSADTLAGVYVVASLARRGSSAVAADPLGLALLYWGRREDVVVLSTRASVAASVLAEASGSSRRRDAFGAGWLAYTGHAIGPWSGYDGITIVPAGGVVEIDARGTVDLRRPSHPVWRAGGEALAGDPRAALSEVRQEITTAIRTGLRDPRTQGSVGLTGGKDSRLILALLLADGMATSLEYQTHGSGDLPDVMIARQLAASFGLRHTTNPGLGRGVGWWPRLRDALPFLEGTDREITFRITASVTSGMQNVGEPHLGRLADPQTLLLSGLCGEALRTNYPASIRFRSKRGATRFGHQFGTAGILDRDALARYRDEMHEILFDGTTERDSPQDVVDGYYIRQRLRHWVGTKLEVDSQARLFPLYSMTAIRLAFGIGAQNRHSEWIHYQLMLGACERLVQVPFAKGEWAPAASGDLVRSKEYTDPIPPSSRPELAPAFRRATQPIRQAARRSGPVRNVNAERRAMQREIDVEIMRRFLRPDATNPAFDIIDATAAQRALDRFEALTEPERLQLYGALSAVIWLGGHELALPRELATT